MRRDARRKTLDVSTIPSPIRPNFVGLASGVWRLASLALIAAACIANPADTTTTITTAPASTTTGVQERWIWGIDSVDLGQGYSLGPCDGDANQIACITTNGSVIGSAEYLALPVDSFEVLEGVDDPVESIELIATDYLSTFRSDRQAACPNLEFRELAATSATVSGLPGLRYGFEELESARVVEKNVIYGVRMDDSIGLFNVSAIADGACLSNEGELTDPAILDALLPPVDLAMASVESG